ncbi:MAG: molybdopterin molybdotransferase MoeA [Candidatus Obscuribacterales bacterium]|nr:molybdopterin molybdotransferase MoeA [Candidatus Obscuribacterales bacterium]
MITFDEALQQILSNVPLMPAKRLTLETLPGFVIAEPVVANFDMPLFDNSAVDGFGVLSNTTQSASDTAPCKLTLQATIQAGDHANYTLNENSALKILTGAPVPASVDAVVMKEFTEECNGSVLIKQSASPGMNIRRKGEEFRAGQTVLESGMLANASVIGLLATLGYSSFSAYKKPTVAVMSTGNELVQPGQSLKPGQIYDSNSFALATALNSLGLLGVEKLHAKDDPDSTRKTLQKALQADVVISCGGVSVGDYDFVKDIAEAMGIKTIFWRIAIKPGKPVYFGILDNGNAQRKLIFGLPGNPVSALVTFHQLVKPALLKMMGLNYQPLKLTAKLTAPLKKQAGRMEFVRGRLASESGQLVVSPAKGQDSHMMGGIAKADCLIYFPLEAQVLNAGDIVTVEQLNWTL